MSEKTEIEKIWDDPDIKEKFRDISNNLEEPEDIPINEKSNTNDSALLL